MVNETIGSWSKKQVSNECVIAGYRMIAQTKSRRHHHRQVANARTIFGIATGNILRGSVVFIQQRAQQRGAILIVIAVQAVGVTAIEHGSGEANCE
jgi:flagellar basal body rod protein FlgC